MNAPNIYPTEPLKLWKKAKRGEVIEIRTMISHVMETGQRKTSDGKPIPRHIINSFTAKYAGADVFAAELHPGISANPFIAFHMRVDGPGDLEIAWTDDSGLRTVEKLSVTVT